MRSYHTAGSGNKAVQLGREFLNLGCSTVWEHFQSMGQFHVKGKVQLYGPVQLGPLA